MRMQVRCMGKIDKNSVSHIPYSSAAARFFLHPTHHTVAMYVVPMSTVCRNWHLKRKRRTQPSGEMPEICPGASEQCSVRTCGDTEMQDNEVPCKYVRSTCFGRARRGVLQSPSLYVRHALLCSWSSPGCTENTRGRPSSCESVAWYGITPLWFQSHAEFMNSVVGSQQSIFKFKEDLTVDITHFDTPIVVFWIILISQSGVRRSFLSRT